MAPPRLIYANPGITTTGITLAVYAPFGTDATLSRYPGSTVLTIQQHPLVAHLVAVAQRGVHVSALIDLQDDDSWLVEIGADKPNNPTFTSRWKLEMDAHNTLSGFLRHTRRKRTGTAVVLALEGHGAGYLPEIDTSQLSTANLTQDGSNEWLIRGDRATPQQHGGAPLLPMGCPLLPMGCPLLPVNHMPLSSWALGHALKNTLADGGPPLAVLHLDNCFNMSVELLHTLHPYADYATGYMNYNFFTAGEAYPAVFQRLLQNGGSATTAQLATWFAEGNRDLLASRPQHPTVGAAVQLSRLPPIATGIDALAKALTKALTGATAAERPAVVGKIRTAIQRAQQFDTVSSMWLDTPDELTDVFSLASVLRSFDVNAQEVQTAATNLCNRLAGIKVYGASGQPWPEPAVTWNFSASTLAMNILCPDPALRGLWDWRSPYYLQPLPVPDQPLLQPQVIDFLKTTAWVKFIIEYHRDVPFVGVLPAAIPGYPVFKKTTSGGVG